MKATPEILNKIDIDKFLEWTKQVYSNLDEIYILLSLEYENRNKIALLQYLIKLNEIKYKIKYKNRNLFLSELKEKTENQIKEYEKYLDFVPLLVPTTNENIKLSNFEKSKDIEINFNEISFILSQIDVFVESSIKEIEQKAEINNIYYEIKYKELLQKDNKTLNNIINVILPTELNTDVFDIADLKTLKYLHNKINNNPTENNQLQKKGNILTEGQRVLLYHYLTKYKIIRPEKIHIDKTGQTFILLSLFGTPTTRKTASNDNFYKYQKNITKLKTKRNLTAVFEVVTHLDNKEMYLEIEQEIKKHNQ